MTLIFNRLLEVVMLNYTN